MFIYNITLKVDNHIVNEWLQWQQEILIPEILGTGFFYDCRFYELLEQDDIEARTFVVQYLANEWEDYYKYIHEKALFFREKVSKKWGHQITSFRTLLKSVD